MTLLERMARKSKINNENVKGHRLENAMTLYTLGKISRDKMISIFNIPVSLQSDFDLIKTKFDSFPNTAVGRADRIEWLLLLQACIGGLQQNDLTYLQFNNVLGLTLKEN